MNHIVNDKSETVVAVGMPGSVEWVRGKYPALVERITRLCASKVPVASVVAELRRSGGLGGMVITSLLEAGHYLPVSDGFSQH